MLSPTAGANDSLLSTVRNFDLGGMAPTFEALGQREELPVLLAWGEADEVVPYNLYAEVLGHVRQARFLSLPKCGHMDMYAVPSIQELLHKNVLAFLAGEEVPLPLELKEESTTSAKVESATEQTDASATAAATTGFEGGAN